MTTDDRAVRSRAFTPRLGSGRWIFSLESLVIVLLVGIAFALRGYRLAASPLWLDEIYGYQLGRLGIGAIFNNSLVDPHPPLFYLIQWAASGFGAFNTEWAWRWLVVVTGALTIPLTYRLARLQGVGPIAALLNCALFAICPTHIYFSQEARSPAIALFICTVTTLLMWRIRLAPQQPSRWIAYAAVSLLGFYIDYAYILAISAQILYLFFVLRLYRATSIYGGLIFLCMLPIAFLGSRSVMGSAKIYAKDSFNVVQIFQSLLGGDIIRYGLHWTHSWLACVICALIVAGLWGGYRSGTFLTTSYYALQIMLPLIIYFGFLSPFLHMGLPLSEAKNFIVLLPSIFVLAAQGMQYIGNRIWSEDGVQNAASLSGATAAITTRRVALSVGLAIIYTSVIYASGINLQRYWNTTKSPEGLAVLDVRTHMLPGDSVISQHYSLDAALSFYLPDTQYYTKPQSSASGYLFSQSLSIMTTRGSEPSTLPLDAIVRRHSRIWLLSLAASDAKLAHDLGLHCVPSPPRLFGPFRVTLFENCDSHTGAHL